MLGFAGARWKKLPGCRTGAGNCAVWRRMFAKRNRPSARRRKKRSVAQFGISGGKTLDTAKALAHPNGRACRHCPNHRLYRCAVQRAVRHLPTDAGEFDRYLLLPNKRTGLSSTLQKLSPGTPGASAGNAGIGDALATASVRSPCLFTQRRYHHGWRPVVLRRRWRWQSCALIR